VLWADETLVLTGPEERLQTACFCSAWHDDGIANPFPPLAKGGFGGGGDARRRHREWVPGLLAEGQKKERRTDQEIALTS
jgi:hypothetical protein